MINRYICLDCETGGIGLDKSLLTVYFEVLDEKFNSIGSLDLKIKHDVYNVTAEALSINNINLVEHHAIAEYKATAGKKLLDLIKKYSQNGSVKLIPVGHGVSFDLQFIWEYLLGRKTFEAYCAYRKLDTAVIAQFLKAQGKLPESVSGSLESLVEYYAIDVPFDNVNEKAHEAKWDTRATIAVLKAQLET